MPSSTSAAASVAGPVTVPDASVGERIFEIHEQLAGFCPSIRRLAVAIYDPATDALRTFLNSTREGVPLSAYERPLQGVPSLLAIAQSRQPRVIDDLASLAGSTSEHTRWILGQGYRSSYTLPLHDGDELLGFLFFDAADPGVFTPPVCARLRVYSQLIGLLVAHERSTVRTLLGAVRTALHFSRFRDEETGAHIDRMSHYCQTIARALPPGLRPDDERIEYLLHLAPLHDLGKIAIPDGILRKPGRLDADEMAVMRTHVDQGVALVDSMVAEFGLGGVHHIDMLRNLIQYHHENWDGSGYRAGLAGAAIPLEARIVKVADVFDALTSERPYKRAWSLDEAFDFVREQAGRQFDPDCAAALLAERAEVTRIRGLFADEGP